MHARKTALGTLVQTKICAPRSSYGNKQGQYHIRLCKEAGLELHAAVQKSRARIAFGCAKEQVKNCMRLCTKAWLELHTAVLQTRAKSTCERQLWWCHAPA